VKNCRSAISVVREQYEYSIKVINPSRMSQYTTLKIHECPQGCFQTLDELRQFMADKITSTYNIEEIATVEIDYIESGHGSKGKNCVTILM